MTDLTVWRAIVMGVLQGATEFLPVSSSGHLVITQHFFDLDPKSPEMLLFDVLVHLATVAAVFVVFRRSIHLYIRRLVRECSPTWSRERYAWRIALLGIAASIPTAGIGLAFKEQFKNSVENVSLVGGCLIATGLLLALTTVVPRGRRGWAKFGWWRAALVGIAQGLAILPGVSRSGSTICTASYLGLRRRWAGEFSFFIAFPAIVGATALQVKDVLDLAPDKINQLPWVPILVGSVAALIVGVFALQALLGVVRRSKLHYFAIYCWILGILIMTGALNWAFPQP